ncbi:MAG: hypothetical protein ACI8UO_002782 [Verrucomicrobiales bacterium]|jgi:hypothetical protein
MLEPNSKSTAVRVSGILLIIISVLAIMGFLLFGKGCFSSPTERSPLSSDQLKRYEKGDIFRTIVTTTVSGPVENKDWGFNGKGT